MTGPTITTATVLGATDSVGTVLQSFSGDFLYLAIVFFVLAIVAAVVGASDVAGISMEVARILIVVFVILAIVSLFL